VRVCICMYLYVCLYVCAFALPDPMQCRPPVSPCM
jgi:hypothetical protein